MYVSHYEITEVLGPGKRLVLWLQGCDKRCDGCINPDGWEIKSGRFYRNDEIKEIILSNGCITGVTISGGEPLIQYDELVELIQWISSCTGLDIILYSGYELREVRKIFANADDELLRYIDIFIDGAYVKSLNSGSWLRGSDNQKMYFFTERYRAMETLMMNSKDRQLDFKVSEDGRVFFIGIPMPGFYEKLYEELWRDEL